MQIRDNKDGMKDTSTFKFVWITFESEKIKEDQCYLNKAISQGYHIVQEYQTSTGLVLTLIKNMENHLENNQTVMEDYSFDSKIGGLQK